MPQEVDRVILKICKFFDMKTPHKYNARKAKSNGEHQFNIGDKVVKNEETWEPNDFDGWGRGIGVGIIVEPPFEMDEGEVDVRWPNGRCFELTRQLRKVN
jgi:hypothetical protein